MVLNGVFIIKLVLFWCFGASTSAMFILRGNSRTFRSSGMLLKGVLMKKLVELLLYVLFFRLVMCDVDMWMCDVWCGEISMCDVWCGEIWMCDVWCGVMRCACVMCDVVWWDVHVLRCECMICDVVWWAIRPKNSAQELLLCVLFFRLVMCDVVRCDVWWLVRCNDAMMCDVVRFRLSGPRTRPKNFFFVFSSFGLWCVMWWDVMSDVWWDAMMCDVWCGEISSIRPKNSAQELLLCVLFFRLVMCDVVRCDVWWLVRCNDVWCVMWWDFVYPAQELGPWTVF